MKVITKSLAELKRPERNVRMHTNRQLAEFRRSIEMFGQIRPIVCDENGVILAGNGLYEALCSMGREAAECYVVSDLSEKEKKKLMLADNRIFSLGVDDMEAFDALIAELQDVDIPGYDEELLSTLIASASDVDSLLSDYGTFSEESQQNMQRAAAPAAPPSAPPTPAGIAPAPAEAPAPEVRQGRYAICPHCGERISL